MISYGHCLARKACVLIQPASYRQEIQHVSMGCAIGESTINRGRLTPCLHASRTLSIISSCLKIFGCLLLVGITAYSAHAQSHPPGDLLEAISVGEDDSMICSFYVNKGKTEASLSQTDGNKFYGKPFWTLKAIKKQLTKLAISIKQLSRATGKKAAKILKKAKADKKQLTKAKGQLTKCAKDKIPDAEHNPIRFGHVKKAIEKQCMQCHSALGWTNEQGFYVNPDV